MDFKKSKNNMRSVEELQSHVGASMGREAADLFIVGGKVVNTVTSEILQQDIAIKGNRIVRVGDISDLRMDYPEVPVMETEDYLIPGLIDTHLHTESTLLTPGHFAEIVVPRGTTTVVVDPHELTNVAGPSGLIHYSDLTKNLPLEFLIEVPSCVPAAPSLEEAINIIPAKDYEEFLKDDRYFALAEMMNYPGVIYGDKEVMTKLSLAEQNGLLREGHAPGLVGRELQAYLTAGIFSCHESIGTSEVAEKLRLGMHVQLREGSFARNLLELGQGIKDEFGKDSSAWRHVITCSDDKHADDIFKEGHIDYSLRMLVNELGLDPITAIQTATLNAATYLQRKDLGIIAPGKTANIVFMEDLKQFNVKEVIANGVHVASNKEMIVPIPDIMVKPALLNTIKPLFIPELADFDFKVDRPDGQWKVHIIGLLNNSLITTHLVDTLDCVEGSLQLGEDDAYLYLLDRYGKIESFQKTIVRGFGFKGKVAIASTVAHDSHQLLIVGNDISCMHEAMKNIIESQGGQTVVIKEDGLFQSKILALPFAGLMSIEPAVKVASIMKDMKEFSKPYITGVSNPFMSLSFLALPVIPELKITNKGLVDVNKFALIDVIEDAMEQRVE